MDLKNEFNSLKRRVVTRGKTFKEHYFKFQNSRDQADNFTIKLPNISKLNQYYYYNNNMNDYP